MTERLKNNDTIGAIVTAGSLGASWGTVGAVVFALSVVLLIMLFAKNKDKIHKPHRYFYRGRSIGRHIESYPKGVL